jgi:hypothetical protein
MTTKGDCFEAAWDYLNRTMDENSSRLPGPRIFLVHGQVFAKEWRVHAWIERDGMVIDVSNSNPSHISLPVGEYYKLRQVKYFVKYSPQEATLAYLSSCASTVAEPETVPTSPGPWDPRLLEAIKRESENRNC